ncbi:MAG: hypothetical protein B9S34_09760 [Opitutia bacterium Tous-C1TDCM]|nr:MAG: hypothetical protein B9S34_09760 [Opitutae bacterium Tous-C1TDCM]
MPISCLRHLIGLAACAATLLNPLHAVSDRPSESVRPGRPNVLLILTDDQGYGDVGFNGNPLVRTPTIDHLAAAAVVFDRFYAYPVCSPTRASLMTGRHAMRTGVIDTEEGASILRPSETTIAQLLRKAGYRTGLFGKWHLGDNAPARPIDHGFEVSLTHVGGMIGAPYSPLDANSYFDPVLLSNGAEKRFKGYCVDILTDAAIEFIKAAKSDPFFVYWAPNTPHHPLTVEDRYAKPYLAAGLSEETARYYGMITNIDDNLARILAVLRETGTAENTLIIFVGDNGTSSLHQQADLWEVGLRGRKTHVYEGGIRVPMLAKLPAGAGVHRRTRQAAGIEDIMPTILDVCGLGIPVHLDGTSLLPHLRGAAETERTIIRQFHRGTAPVRYRNVAVIQHPYKLVQPAGRGVLPFSEEAMRFELYDLADDPGESRDLATQHPDIVARMRAVYSQWFDAATTSGFAPVPIWIGADRQGSVRLSRQDWRGGGLFDGELGHYIIDVRKAGKYRINCRWSELLKEARPVTLRIGNQVWHRSILYAEAESRFEGIQLPAGVTELEAWVEIGGRRCGFRFIEIEPLP